MKKNITKVILFMSIRTFWTIVISCMFFTALAAKNTSAQSVKEVIISVDFNKASLSSVFNDIERKTEFKFLYDKNKIDTNPLKVTLQQKRATVAQILQGITLQTGVTFRQVNNSIAVHCPKSSGLAETPVQTGTVRGSVLDAKTGETLPGASVYFEDTNKGVATDRDGFFTINNIEPGIHTLVATFVGYKKQSKKIIIAANDTLIVNFKLATAVKGINEVVVTGYYSIPKERATGSFSHIDQKELETINSLSIKDKLEGLVPGLLFEPNYNSDQSPTTERSRGLTIRGNSTLGDNSPLIVVDGFPVVSSNGIDPWSTINPNDVKSVTVLKDAAAASIWGAKAANGVIVIETKSGGKSARPSFDASIEYLTQPAPDLYDIPFASSKESVEIYKSLILDGSNFDPLMQSYFRDQYELPEAIDVLVKMKAGEITTAAGNKRLDQLSQIDVRDEFSNLFYRKLETNSKLNLSYRNGNDYSSTVASVSAINNTSYAIGDSDIQVIANIKNQFKPTDWFSTTFGINYSLSKQKNNGVQIGEIQNIPQMSRILDDDGNYVAMIKNSGDDYYYDVPTSKRSALVDQYNLPYDWDWNIKREVDNKDRTKEINDLRLNSKITLTPFKQLAIDLSYQFQRNHSLTSEYYNEESWYVRNAVNENARPDGSFPVPAGGMLYEDQSNFTSHDGRLQITYNNTFGDHDIRILGGSEIEKKYYEDVPYGFYGYDPQSLTHISNINFEDEVNPKLTGDDEFRGSIPPIPTVPNTSIFLGGRDDRFLSYYGNAGYTYRNKYDLTGSIRLDQTNLYGRAPSYRRLPQWSVGAGWTISDEPFFNLNKIDYLKLRASYGWNGHIDKNASPFISGTPWVDPINQLQYAAVQETPNPSLTWEKTANYNVGIDFAILNERLKGSVETYLKKSRDVLSDVEVNPTYGFYYDGATLNNGNITNKGVEINLSSLVLNKGLKWQTGFNYSFNKNVAQDVQTSVSNIAAWTALSQFNPVNGQPVDYIAVADWAGYSDEGLPQIYYDGEVKDVTEIDYVTSDLDKIFTFAGQRSPKHFGSWVNTFSYQNLKFSFRLLYKFGHKFFKDTPPRNLLYNYTSFRNYFTFNTDLLANRWQSPADNETASMYSLDNKLSYTNALTTDYIAKYNSSNLLDAGQIRLQNISLAYNVPAKFLGSIKRAQIQLQARNLGPIFLKNKEGIDPAFPKYSSSLYSAFYNIIRDRPTYSINIKIGI